MRTNLLPVLLAGLLPLLPLLPLLTAAPAAAKFPDCASSDAVAEFTTLCPSNAGDSLHVVVELRDAFQLPADDHIVFLRCASPAGGPEIPGLARTSYDGVACIAATVGDVIDDTCCDSLEVVVHDVVECALPVVPGTPAVPAKPVGPLSLATVPTSLLVPSGGGQEVTITVDLRGPCNEPVVGWPGELVCAECPGGPGPVCAEAPSDAAGRSTIHTTIGELVGAAGPCEELSVRVCADPTACLATIVLLATGVPEAGEAAAGVRLDTGAPNPFAIGTSFRWAIPAPSAVRLTVFDVRGRVVRRLVEGETGAGEHTFTWDGRNDGGRALPAGAYFVRLEAGEESITRKVSLRN